MNKIYITILLITIGLIGFFAYYKLSYLNIVVKFDELEPFEKKMNVYYKGFKVGETTKIYPDDDYQNTYIKLRLSPQNMNLPNNMTAVIKKRKSKEYITLIYPEAPAIKRIKEDDIIKGETSKDINTMINDSLNENDVDEIIGDAGTLIESANNAVQSLNSIFIELNGIIKASRNDIRITTRNLAKTTTNLENISSKLNTSLSEEKMIASIDNIEETTENIKHITKNIDEITTQIDKVTIPIVNSIACDGKEISNGVKKTLKKRMGLSRLFFGKPIND